MALGNRVKGTSKPPRWMTRGRARNYSSYVGPAEMGKALFSGRWNFSPRQLYEVARGYEPERFLPRVVEARATHTILVWSPGFSHEGDRAQWEILRTLVPKLKRKRVHPVAYLSLTNCFRKELFPKVPEAREWLQQNAHGGPVPYDFADYGDEEPARYLMCVNRREWREYLKEKVLAAVEAGFDGLFFDNLFSRCFCPVCREGFRRYTEKVYGRPYETPLVDEKAKVEASGAGRGLELVSDFSELRGEKAFLLHALNLYRMNSTAGFLRELRDAAEAARAAASRATEENGGKKKSGGKKEEPLLFYFNAHERWPLNEVGNAVLSEDAVRPGFSADGRRLITNVGLWKYLFEDGGRDKPFENGLGRATIVPNTPRSRRQAWAEQVACGGTPLDWDNNRVPADCVEFHVAHPGLFVKTDPVNACGVVVREQGFLAEKNAAFTLLARRNIQFDVLPYEQLARFPLKRYRVLYLRDLEFMSDQAADEFRRFVRGGGTLIATGRTGMGQDDFRLREQGALAELFGAEWEPELKGRFEKEVGKGRTIFYPRRLEEAWEEGGEVEETESFSADLRRGLGEPEIEVEAPDGLCAFLWGKGTRRVVHLVNLRPEQVAEVKIALPHCGGRKFTVHSPDRPAPTLEVLESGHARSVFVVRRLDVYAVVEIT